MSSELPAQLRAALANETASVPPATLRTEVERLMSAYRQDVSPRLATYESAIAYANYRMPGTYAAIRSVLSRIPETIPDLAPRSMLDYGGGTGAGVWAANSVFGGIDAYVFDQSRHVTSLAERLITTTGAVALPVFKSVAIQPPFPATDLAMAAYVLGEIPDHDRTVLVAGLLASAETLVLVEPGTTPGYRRILAARQQAIAAGFRVAAPCPHEAGCPLEDGDWCHFGVRFPRSSLLRSLKNAEHDYEDEKFAYIAVTRKDAEPQPGRIVRHPQKRSGLVMLEVCQADGQARRVTVSRRQGETYRVARQSRWGDPWG